LLSGFEKIILQTGGGELAFIVFAILIIAAVIIALIVLKKFGWFSSGGGTGTTLTPTGTTTPPPLTVEELLEQIAEKKTEWKGLIKIHEDTTTQPNGIECDKLKAIRDAVEKMIKDASDLGAPAATLSSARAALAEMYAWLKGWDCE